MIEPGVFGPDRLDELITYFRSNGYAVLRGVFDDDLMHSMEAQCVDAQSRVVAGMLDDKHGTVIFVDDADLGRARAFANYVVFIEQLSTAVTSAIADPTLVSIMRTLLGDDCWTDDNDRFGVVYQDARPGRGEQLHPHRLAQRLAEWAQPARLAIGGVHVPHRCDVAGQRLPARGARQPPVGDTRALRERERGDGPGRLGCRCRAHDRCSAVPDAAAVREGAGRDRGLRRAR